MLGTVRTIHEAKSYVRDLFASQVTRAEQEGAAPNEAVGSDSDARSAFLLLLPPTEQRASFLWLVAQGVRAWPRIRTLVGTPPYSFLLPSDEGLLQTTGIAKHRSNLTQKTSRGPCTSSGEFAGGHYTDMAERTYRVIGSDESSRVATPWRQLQTGVRAIIDVKLHQLPRKRKIDIINGQQGPIAMQKVVFPRIGELVRLTLVPRLHDSTSAGQETEVKMRVSALQQRDVNSTIARLLVQIE